MKAPEQPLSVFATNLRSLRARAGLKQREVASKIGRGQGVMSKWEHDKSKPDVDELRALSEFFAKLFPDMNINAATLVGETDLVLPRGPRSQPRSRKKKSVMPEKRTSGANAGA